MRRLVGVFGASGFAREVMALMRRQLSHNGLKDEIVFVDIKAGPPINAVPVMAEDEFLSSTRPRAFVVAIADSAIRKRLFSICLASGAKAIQVRASSADVFDEVTLGSGAILCGHSTITSNTHIGQGFHLNISSYVAHDCRIGNFVTFGPNVVCAGNVIIEDGAYIGAGALIRQGKVGEPVVVGAAATVGMGAVVIKSVPPNTVVVGNPARRIKKG